MCAKKNKLKNFHPNFHQENNFLKTQIFWLKLMAMWPVDYKKFLPENLSFLSNLLNGFYYIFWQFICLQLIVLHIVSLAINWNKGLDEISDFIMTTLIYVFSYFITVYYQVRYVKHKELEEFVNQNFKSRSAKGLTFTTSEFSYLDALRKYKFWVFVCVFGTVHTSLYPILVRKKILPLECWYPFEVIVSLMIHWFTAIVFTCTLFIPSPKLLKDSSSPSALIGLSA